MTSNTGSDRAKALRKLLGLTQEQLAARSGILKREEITKLEKGVLKATTARTRTGLARGFGISERVLDDLLDGRISAEQAAKTVGAATSAPEGSRVVELDSRYRSRAQLVALLGDDADQNAIRALLIEELAVGAEGDPGLEYWETRYNALVEKRNKLVPSASVGAALEDDEAPRMPPRIPPARR